MSTITVTHVSDNEQRELELWTVQQCAEFVGVKPPTWRAYVKRGQAPAPLRRFGRTPIWDATTVRQWKEERPGQGRKRPQAAQEPPEPSEK